MNKLILLTVLFACISAMAMVSCGGGGGDDGDNSDKTPPQINSIAPPDNSEGISLDTMVQVQFSEDLDSSSITESSFTLKSSTENIVIGTVVYSDRTAVFTPDSPLEYYEIYTAEVTTTVKDIAGNNMQSAKTWSFRTVASGTVSAPYFSPMPGIYGSSSNIVITCDEEGAVIRYTVNGPDPTSSSGTIYDAALPIGENSTIRAAAFKAGMEGSSVAEGVYYIRASSPTFNPVPGTYYTDKNIELSTTTSGGTIRYTLNGDEPTADSDLYTGAIPVTGHGTVILIRAITVKDNMEQSDVTSGEFIIDYSREPARWGQAIWGFHRWSP